MSFETKKHTKNPLLHREEFLLLVKSDHNPTKDEILAFVKKDPEVCVIKKIRGNFGRDKFKVEVFAYDTKEKKDKIEYIPRKLRKKLEEEKKKQEEQKAKESAEGAK